MTRARFNGAMASPVLWIPKLQARARAFRLSRPTRSERFGFGNQAHLSDNLQRLFNEGSNYNIS